MKIKTLDEFMVVAAEHGVVFKIEGDGDGFRFAVGWPKKMDKKMKATLQRWVDANDFALSVQLIGMADEIRAGIPGVTIISPKKQESLH